MEIVSQHMCTDLPDCFGQSFLGLCGYSMSKRAAENCFREAGMSVRDIDLFEVHDCFAPNEVCPTSIVRIIEVDSYSHDNIL